MPVDGSSSSLTKAAGLKDSVRGQGTKVAHDALPHHIVRLLQAGTTHAQGLRIGSYRASSNQHSARLPYSHRQTGQGQSEPEQATTEPQQPDGPSPGLTPRPASVNNRYASTLASEASSCSESASHCMASAHTSHAVQPAAAASVRQPKQSPKHKHAGSYTASSSQHSTHGHRQTGHTARPSSSFSARRRAGSLASIAHETSSVSLQQAGSVSGRQAKTAPAERQLDPRAGHQTLHKAQPAQGGHGQQAPGVQHATTPLPLTAHNGPQIQQPDSGPAHEPSIAAPLQQLCSLSRQTTTNKSSSQPAMIEITDRAADRPEKRGFAAQPSRLPKPRPLHCATNQMQALSPGRFPPASPASLPSARCRAGVDTSSATNEADPFHR